jgi:inosine-uridine nucleoside N-ribohydrolase
MLALMMLDRAGVAVAGVSLSFGNAGLAQVERNAAGMAALLGWRFPIHSGAARAVLGEVLTPAHVLGPTGLPTLGRPLPEAPPLPAAAPAFDALCDWLAGGGGRLLALGPLTNLAAVALARPQLLERAQITWMGGSAGRGNHTASAEFNAFADPEALAVVLASGVPLDMVDLETCRQVGVTPRDTRAVRSLMRPRADLLADLFGGYIDIALSRGRPAMALYDPVAAAALALPGAVGFAPARIGVELAGTLTRGRTVVDLRDAAGSPHRIGTSADAEAIRDLALDALIAAAAP